MPHRHGASTVAVEGECVFVFGVFYWSEPAKEPLAGARLTLLLCTLLNAAADSAICLNEPAFVRLSGKLSQSFKNVVFCWGGIITLKAPRWGWLRLQCRRADFVAVCLAACARVGVRSLPPALPRLLLSFLAHIGSFVTDAHALNSFVLCFCGPSFWGTPACSFVWALQRFFCFFFFLGTRLSVYWCFTGEPRLVQIISSTCWCCLDMLDMSMFASLELRDKGCSADICRSSSIHQPQPPL